MKQSATPLSSAEKRARVRMIGILVLLLGVCCAGVVYWIGTRSPDLRDDISMVGYGKSQSRQMGQLYGKMGPMVDDLIDDLKRPGTQAKIILAITSVIVLGCFCYDRNRNEDGESR